MAFPNAGVQLLVQCNLLQMQIVLQICYWKHAAPIGKGTAYDENTHY